MPNEHTASLVRTLRGQVRFGRYMQLSTDSVADLIEAIELKWDVD